LSLPQSDIEGFQFILDNLNAQRNKLEKEFKLEDHTFHVEGFTSTSFDRAIAEKFAIEGVWGERTPVIIEMTVELYDGKYRGF